MIAIYVYITEKFYKYCLTDIFLLSFSDKFDFFLNCVKRNMNDEQ